MKTCKSCGEINGSNSTKCFKCGTSLGSVVQYQKICPKCKTIYSGSTSTCPDCHTTLSVYDPNLKIGGSFLGDVSGGTVLIAILLPIIGIIMGLIYIARGNDSEGKSAITVSIISSIVWGIVSYFLFF